VIDVVTIKELRGIKNFEFSILNFATKALKTLRFTRIIGKWEWGEREMG
jgi:hypothetical protein